MEALGKWPKPPVTITMAGEFSRHLEVSRTGSQAPDPSSTSGSPQAATKHRAKAGQVEKTSGTGRISCMSLSWLGEQDADRSVDEGSTMMHAGDE